MKMNINNCACNACKNLNANNNFETTQNMLEFYTDQIFDLLYVMGENERTQNLGRIKAAKNTLINFIYLVDDLFGDLEKFYSNIESKDINSEAKYNRNNSFSIANRIVEELDSEESNYRLIEYGIHALYSLISYDIVKGNILAKKRKQIQSV